MKLEVSVEKKFPQFHLQTDFALEGQKFGLFGPSGSGKSTLVGILAGLIAPDRGLVRLNDRILYDGSRRIQIPPERRRIAVVFQDVNLFPHLNVRRNLFYGWRRSKPSERRIDPEALIEVLGLATLLERDTNSLSGGERRRVALGRAVLAGPQLILMDEPLTGLDERLKYQIMPYLQRIFREFEIPLIMISHSLNEIRLMSEEVVVLERGLVSARMTVEALARARMGRSRVGYINFLNLHDPRPADDLWKYRWNNRELILTDPGLPGENLFEISSKDITLFKRDPEASSARNILYCRVKNVFESGNRIGVELSCDGASLISEIVGDAVAELGIRPGAELVAVIKASAFRRLF